MTRKHPPPKVKSVKNTDQPSKAELAADLRVDATFEDAIKALCSPGGCPG